MKLIKFIFTFFLLLSSILYCESITKTGSTAAQFLKIPVGPRAIGMGGAFTATSNDITATYWNPAGLASITTNEVIFNHIEWISDVNLDFAAFATSVAGFGTLGGFVSVLSSDDMMVTTIEHPEGTGELFKYNTLSAGLSFARALTDNFSIGFNAKYIGENLWHMSAKGFAFDLGTIYRIPILNEFRIGASISNFGTKMQLSGRDGLIMKQSGAGDGNLVYTNVEMEQYDLPLLFRFGVAADLVSTGSHRITTAIDAVHPNDHSEYINSGVEYSWNEIFSLRAGYNSLFERDTEKGLTFGFGLNYRLFDFANVKIDYAYQDFHRLKNVQYISVGIRF
ncbi:MAG: PorV/PorQ family protein [Bacteroidota bacterium]|nr:PorV/PorQ family protein [Bacteroidota bacterium]MDP4191617.1 PorV/PorQ family protein [Bacteroidota bacterium]MDP4193850.1 PorV/PorQ family protein [Bacteroidota bacterium]